MQRVLIQYILIFNVFFFLSCSKNNIATSIEGEWVLENRFYGDVIMSPCNEDVTANPMITLTISKEGNDIWNIEGKSVINTYFSNLVIEDSFENDTRLKINVNNIGATRIGGATEEMNCETEYFRLLREAKEIRINGTILNWGIFPDTGAPLSRNGGTFLIFKKSK